MSEFHTPGVLVFDGAQFMATESIATGALNTVENHYGSGYPLYHGGENGGLAYHNRHHSEFVQEGTGRMCEALGLSPTERAIGRLAAAAHDIVQLKPRGVMERESANWLEEEMRLWRLPEEAVHIGALAILGTKPLFDGPRLSGQVATELRYPSKSAELVAKSVACADLGELYAPSGPLLGHELYKEINGIAPGDEPDITKLIGFQRGQVALADGYRYPLAKGEEVFGKLRGKVVDYSAAVLDALEQGKISSWSELIARDQAFMLANQ